MHITPKSSAPVPASGLSLFRGLKVLAASCLVLPALALAQADAFGLHEKNIERVENAQKIGMLSTDVFGDSISHFLSVTFNETTGWQVDGSSPNARCSNAAMPPATPMFQAHDYWSGYNLNVPGGGQEELLKAQAGELPQPSSGGPYPWVTKSQWRISCLSDTKNGYPGQAFLAHGPDGSKVYLDHVIVRDAPALKYGGTTQQPVMGVLQRDTIYFMVSRVEDRFGNWVNYTWSGDKLQTISSSDGRQISLTYSGNRIASANSPWARGLTVTPITS